MVHLQLINQINIVYTTLHTDSHCSSHLGEQAFSLARNPPYQVAEADWCAALQWRSLMQTTWWDELREVLWLASVVGGLSALGVLLAVAAVMIGNWQHMPVTLGSV
jgi:hypothetical protein